MGDVFPFNLGDVSFWLGVFLILFSVVLMYFGNKAKSRTFVFAGAMTMFVGFLFLILAYIASLTPLI
jgi:uncharacterized membrane protein